MPNESFVIIEKIKKIAKCPAAPVKQDLWLPLERERERERRPAHALINCRFCKSHFPITVRKIYIYIYSYYVYTLQLFNKTLLTSQSASP